MERILTLQDSQSPYYKKYILPVAVFSFSFILLSFLQVKLSNPIILLERFYKGAGWIEIFFVAGYGALIAYRMQDPVNVPKWRRLTWIIFSIIFFSQLIIGLTGLEKFLMTGKLHLPIPAMIISGPVYRGHLSVMTILFLSTVILTGPAWCSHLCYFGAFDSIAARGKTSRTPLKNKTSLKFTIFFLVIAITILLKWFNLPTLVATITAIVFALAGIAIMIIYSQKQGRMVHCTLFCPIGSIVNVMKNINPFRIYIDSTCNQCMKCTGLCKYDALKPEDVKKYRPAYSCTLCGDCLAACKDQSLKYKFPGLISIKARNLYLFITISLHVVFLATARI